MYPTTWFFFFLLIHFGVELFHTLRESGCPVTWRWFRFDMGCAFDKFSDYWYKSDFLYTVWFFCCLAPFMPYGDVGNMVFHWAQIRNVSIKEMIRDGL